MHLAEFQLDPAYRRGNISGMGRNFRQLRLYLAALSWGCGLLCSSFAAQAAQTQGALFQELTDNYATLQGARSAFAQALREGRLNAREKSDYQGWIRQLGSRVQQNCLELARVHAAPLPADPPCRQFLEGAPRPADIDLATEKTREESTDQLQQEMNRSLGEFDERLLREQDRVRAQRPRSDSASSAGGGSGLEGSQGQGGAQSAGAKTAQKGETVTDPQEQTASAEGGEERTTAGEASQGAGSAPRGAPGRPSPGSGADIPDDIPDGSDDDIVARQLREAAVKEQDPELREKLWEEYRRYKAGTG